MIFVTYPESIDLERKCEAYLNSVCIGVTAEVVISRSDEQSVDGFAFSVSSDEIHIGISTVAEKVVLAHELIHAKQYITGELQDLFGSGSMLWKGTRTKIDNINSPWEIEAYTNEQEVLTTWLQ